MLIRTRPALRLRRAALTITTMLAAGLLAACGGSSDEASDAGSSAGASDAFPVTVEHRFGTSTVESADRIAVVGLSEQDIVLALGTAPIATTEWYGEQPSAVWPWAQDELGSARPAVLSTADGFEFEKVASLRPDLIIGTNSGMTEADYAKFSAIAPTIPGVKGGTDYFSPWEGQTVLVAEAMGKQAEGEKLVGDIRASYAKVAAEHPEFAGRSATFSQNAFYDGILYVYPDGVGTEFLTMLGFTIDPALTDLAPAPGQQAQISTENLSKIDGDVIVVAAEKPEDVANLEKVPTWNRLEAVQGKHVAYTDATLSGAMYFVTPLSLPYVLEKLTPQLEDAVAGTAPAEMVTTSD